MLQTRMLRPFPPWRDIRALPVHEVRPPVGVPHLAVAPSAEVPQGVARLLRGDSAEVLDPELGHRAFGPVRGVVSLAPARVARAGVLHHHSRPQQARNGARTPGRSGAGRDGHMGPPSTRSKAAISDGVPDRWLAVRRGLPVHVGMPRKVPPVANRYGTGRHRLRHRCPPGSSRSRPRARGPRGP
jgi:hypothetical protein